MLLLIKELYVPLLLLAAGLVSGCGSDAGAPVAPEPEAGPPKPLEWRFTNPTPQSDNLRSVDSAAGFNVAVGDYGVIVVRSDTDTEWRAVARPFENHLRDVTVMDNRSALVVGDDGIALTRDGGATWSVVQRISPGLSFESVASLGNTAIAVGDDLVFVSTDGGVTWQPSLIPDPSNLRAVAIASDATALVASSRGALFRSFNAGASWEDISDAQIGAGVRRIEFASQTRVFAIRGTKVMRSENQGLAWTEVELGQFWRDIKFINASTGVVMSSSATFQRTQNGGDFWAEFIGTQHPDPGRFFDAVQVESSSSWRVFGTAGHIYSTRNAAAQWTSESEGDRDRFLDVTFAGSTGLAIGIDEETGTPAVYRSRDDGESWLRLGNVSAPTAIELFDDNLGLLVTDDGAVFRTRDGGEAWTDVSPPPTQTVPYGGCLVLDPDTYLVCGDGASILRSADAGLSWETVTFARAATAAAALGSQTLNTLAHFPGTRTLVSAGSGFALRSLDGGLTWNAPIALVGSFDVATIDATTAIALGRQDILRTVDAGETWALVAGIGNRPKSPAAGVARGETEEFTSVAMRGQRGVAVGLLGLMLETIDAGRTWQQTDRVTGRSLFGVAFTGAGSAITMGREGTIIKGR